ncbi:unnamed protein product, partial [Amoebophrya sp. A25]|eukprot:GSA25T00018833001.1
MDDVAGQDDAEAGGKSGSGTGKAGELRRGLPVSLLMDWPHDSWLQYIFIDRSPKPTTSGQLLHNVSTLAAARLDLQHYNQ